MAEHVRRRVVKLLSPAVVLVAVIALVAAVLEAEGYRTPELELHDAGVWISWSDQGQVGRTNTQIGQVDVKVGKLPRDLELLQADEVVLVYSPAGLLYSIDGRTALPSAPIQLPVDSKVALGGPATAVPTAAVLSPLGDLWVASGAGVMSLGFPTSGGGAAEGADDVPAPAPEDGLPDPDDTIEGATHLEIGVDGVVHVLTAASGEVRSYDSEGAFLSSTTLTRGVADPDAATFAVVGSTPVVLDQGTAEVLLPAGAVALDAATVGANPVLQLTGSASDQVLVATDERLVEVPLDGTTPSPITDAVGTGEAARPIRVGACALSAWSRTPTLAQVCGDPEPTVDALSGLTPGERLGFRTNRGKVVLNGLDDGKAVVVSDGALSQVDWNQAEVLNSQDENAPPKETESDEVDPDQKPPVAKEDLGDEGFGTRPDRAVVIDPMRNDTDPNDDVLVIEEVTGITLGAKVEKIQGGLALQVTPAPGETGTIRFRYTINDGLATSNAADVEVKVHPPSVNSPPVLDEESLQTYVVKGKAVSHNVLAGAYDPEGDPIELLLPMPDAVAGTPGSYSAASDGTVVYRAPGTARAGDVRIPFVATDGTGGGNATADGVLVVSVRDKAGQPPKARGDHAETIVQRAVTVDVLANDSDADGDALRVFRAGPVDGAEVSIVDGQVEVLPSAVGTLRIPYLITDGTNEATGQLRVDVSEAGKPSAPVAVRDDVVLRATAPALADVLANDSDADGDVLVVVSVVPGAKLSVEVIDRRFLRISSADGGALAETTSFTYKVTDGLQAADGVVVVRPGPTSSEDQYPTAVNDDVRVRAGNVAAFAVLANDSDPEGGPLRVRLPDDLDPELAKLVFVQGEVLRFVAPADPGTVRIPYQAVDAGDRATTAFVNIQVDPPDVANEGPKPPDVTARTVAGVAVEILIPVSTMDPNGDPVTLLGVADGPPLHGSVVEVAGDRLTYLPDLWDKGFWGTDTFTYRVRDAEGAEATATVRVGVAAPPTFNSPPVAIDDAQEVAEGGQVRINVVRNDSDPDDDRLRIEPDSVGIPEGVPWSAEPTDGDQSLQFTADGMELGDEAVFTYEVTDGILRDRAFVRVKVADQENLPPVALDDVHPPTEPGRRVEVEVLENDIDPDGSDDDLEVVDLENAPPDAEIAGRFIKFVMPTHDVDLRYTVKDAFGGSSRAVLRVRALDETHFRPVAVYDDLDTPVVTDMNTPITYPVLANDEVSPGRTLQLVSVGEARHGTCAVTGEDSVTFTPDTDFVGVVGCSYTISDGEGTDAATKRAVGMLGVTVRRVGNTPPVFRSQPVAVVADDETTVDLLPAVFDPDEGDDIAFSGLTGMEGAIDARFEGTELTVEAGPEALTGELDLAFDVSDGTDVSPGSVTVVITEFTGALAILAPDTGIETPQRVPIEAIEVLANDQLSDTGEPLKIVELTEPVGARLELDDAQRTIRFEPEPEFHGETTFEYTVDDGTQRADRQVTSTVTVNVIGFPDPPPAPTASQEDRAITLSWGVPADNGAPITEYWVRAAGGPVSGDNPRRASGNSITFDGLTNSTPYTFEIAAVNRAAQAARDGGQLEDWEYSEPSIPLEPNALPPVPTNLAATWLEEGGKISLAWDQPAGEGRAPKEYDLRIIPAPEDGVGLVEGLPAAARDGYVVDDLLNGTTYEFQVRAINILDTGTQAEGVSEFSIGASEFPSTRPAKMPAPVATQGQIDELVVTWTKPTTVEETGGDPDFSYTLYWYLNGSTASVGQTVITDPDQTSHPVSGLSSGDSYTFTVTATNRVGESEQSDPSQARFAEDRPLGTTGLTATDGEGVSVLTPSFPPKHDQGTTITAYQWRKVAEGTPFPADPEAGWTTYSPPLARSSGVPAANGGRWFFQVRACNSRGCSADPGVQNSAAARPYTNPSAPTNVRGSNSGTSINWAWNAANGNGRPVVDYEVTIEGRGTFFTSGLTYTTGGYTNDGSRQNISVRARYGTTGPDASDAGRRHSSAGTGSVVRPSPPPPTSWNVTVNTTTCPEKDFSPPSNFKKTAPVACNQDGAGGYLFPGAGLTVTCYEDHANWNSPPDTTIRWYRYSTAPRYVYSSHVNGSTAGMPSC